MTVDPLASWRNISIHALLAESDTTRHCSLRCITKFLSTLSLRRATRFGFGKRKLDPHFYPRSPCGERPEKWQINVEECAFLSTLSLRRATRLQALRPRVRRFLSTLSLRRATWSVNNPPSSYTISIHALLAESDFIFLLPLVLISLFLSTLSLRRATLHLALLICPPPDFYPRSPCGERRSGNPETHRPCAISIHALLAESD